MSGDKRMLAVVSVLVMISFVAVMGSFLVAAVFHLIEAM